MNKLIAEMKPIISRIKALLDTCDMTDGDMTRQVADEFDLCTTDKKCPRWLYSIVQGEVDCYLKEHGQRR